MSRTKTIASLFVLASIVLTVGTHTPQTVLASDYQDPPPDPGVIDTRPNATNTFSGIDSTLAGTSVIAPTATTVYWGALIGSSTGVQAPVSSAFATGGSIYNFEQHAQKKMSIIHWGQAWKMNGAYQAFYAPWFDNVRNHGSIPLLDWSSWLLGGGATQSDFKLSAIYNGYHDSFLKQWATAAKTWGHPFFLRFDWEMNGNWTYPWSEQLNGNLPGDFIKAWRHVHDIFKQNGATNVSWVWCPNISGNTTLPMAGLYPGDAYVDWTCMDGYNKYPVWLGFYTIFHGYNLTWLKDSYKEILTVAPTKPIMIGEFASLEAGDGGTKKANWINDTLGTQIPINFPRVKAIVWFNWNAGSSTYTFPIESTTAAQSAFAASIKSTYYAANNFSGLSTSPIPPLR